ncbi:RNA polymerase sigma factor [Sphingobium nicotianae]|uniref:RNA polymerase sigma factor n=1 Tax=Sphingobium nicotianae TaxID=2782607 RepID=A0A9X1IQX8_9SPHN|nr:RNA polymerase sigma factor [Sphingobium nicotianae]MBT2186961.1 RNA polymerase sigma factor [Sphingobium nicotianae]
MSGLKALFLQQRPMLTRLMTARLGNPADAEDVLQELWLKLESLPEQTLTSPQAYLFRAAANLASDRRLSLARAEARDGLWFDAQPEASEYPDAEHVLLARERLAQVEAAMAAMPERMSTALRMFRIEKRSQKEIAGLLGITVSGVEKLLKRAYRQLLDIEGA